MESKSPELQQSPSATVELGRGSTFFRTALRVGSAAVIALSGCSRADGVRPLGIPDQLEIERAKTAAATKDLEVSAIQEQLTHIDTTKAMATVGELVAKMELGKKKDALFKKIFGEQGYELQVESVSKDTVSLLRIGAIPNAQSAAGSSGGEETPIIVRFGPPEPNEMQIAMIDEGEKLVHTVSAGHGARSFQEAVESGKFSTYYSTQSSAASVIFADKSLLNGLLNGLQAAKGIMAIDHDAQSSHLSSTTYRIQDPSVFSKAMLSLTENQAVGVQFARDDSGSRLTEIPLSSFHYSWSITDPAERELQKKLSQ